MLSSQAVLLQHGVPRSVLTYLLQRSKYINLEYQDLLCYYKLLKWRGDYTLAMIHEGLLRRDNIDFIVIFGTPRGTLLANPESQFNLSFRQAIPEYEIPAYVLIS